MAGREEMATYSVGTPDAVNDRPVGEAVLMSPRTSFSSDREHRGQRAAWMLRRMGRGFNGRP